MTKVQGFNYDGLEDAKTRKTARDAAKAIKSNLQKATTAIVDVGKKLLVVRDQLSDEEWRTWLEAEFSWSQAQASNYMRSAQQFGELNCLEMFQPTALFVLCRNKVSEEAVADAIIKAESGELVTHKTAKELVAKYQPEPNRTPAPASTTPAAAETIADQDDSSAAEIRDAISSVIESAEDVFATIDQFCARVDQFSANLNRDEREELADRFFGLAMQLRAAAKAEQQTSHPTTRRSAKPRKTTKAA